MPPRNHRRRRRPSRHAFTLVELLVVLGIIVLLIGLLSPMIARTYRTAERAKVAGDMNAIASALEAYKLDFNSYPPVPTTASTLWAASGQNTDRPNPASGAQVLCSALLGLAKGSETSQPYPTTPSATQRPKQDGLDGPGFRVNRFPGPDGQLNTADDDLQGKAYPPYLQPDRFKVIKEDGTAFLTNDNQADFHNHILRACISDKFRKPILYFPAQGKPNVKAATGEPYVSATASNKPMFLSAMNPQIPIDGLRIMLGDDNKNGRIDGSETARFTGPFMLWSAGPDENYGAVAGDAPDTGVLNSADADKCDDITNFRS